jgi:uncharacterized protein YecT (DUF1311 family)
MNKRPLLLALLLAVLLCPATAWPEQDKPSLAEAKAAYKEADRALNAAYQSAKAELSEDAFEDLKTKQRGWIRYRDYFSNDVLIRDDPSLADVDLTQTAIHWQTMAGITEQRTAILQSIVGSELGKDFPLTGRWIDGFGGYLNIVEQDGQIAFEIDVVRGPTHHLGHIAGRAQVNGQLIRYSDGGEDDGKGYTRKPAWVTFLQRPDHIELITANAQYYCGARAYFDNDYYRVGDLTDEDRQRVLKQAAGDPEAGP